MESLDNNEFSDYATAKLGECIEERGVKISTIANAVNVSVYALYRAFGEAHQPLKADTFLKVCDFLNVDPNEFLKPGEVDT